VREQIFTIVLLKVSTSETEHDEGSFGAVQLHALTIGGPSQAWIPRSMGGGVLQIASVQSISYRVALFVCSLVSYLWCQCLVGCLMSSLSMKFHNFLFLYDTALLKFNISSPIKKVATVRLFFITHYLYAMINSRKLFVAQCQYADSSILASDNLELWPKLNE
jgi:hypothetical protein